jgi:hypothetical protein
MKGYKYTIESVGGITTSATSKEPIVINSHIFQINMSGKKVYLNTDNIIRITEEEVEI